ncbi:MAG: hypothetical protein QM722_03080 [Piscinibacter sp.]
MGGVTIPKAYDITLHGGADMDLDNIHIKEMPQINMAVKEVPQVNLAIKELPALNIAVTQLPTIKLEMAVKELPTIKLDADVGIKPTRVSMPMNTHVCLKLLGLKLIDLSLCGENMVIIEPYVPRRAEIGCA